MMQQEISGLKKIVQDALAQAKSEGADETDVSVQKSTGFDVKVRLGEVDTISFNRDQGIDIEVYFEKRKGIASTSDLTPESVQTAVHIACQMAKVTQSDPFAGLAEKKYMVHDYPDLDLYHPWVIEMPQAIEWAKSCEQAAFDKDKRIVNSEGATLATHETCTVLGNSHGFIGHCFSTRHSASCVVLAKQQDMQRDYWYTVARNAQYLESSQSVGEKASVRAVQRLNARRIKTGQTAIIFAAEIASSLWGHFIAAISGGNLYRNASFLCDHLHQKIFPEFVRIHEMPHVRGALGSAPFDSEGLATRAKDFITQGVLQSYVLDSYAARKLKLEPTGNGSGVHNLTIDDTGVTLEDLFKQMGTGLYVTELMGQGVNILTGDYSRGVAGFWVENGEIQYPVHEVTIAGNLRDMFERVIAIGNDVDKRGNILTGSVWLDKMMVAGE